VGPGHEQARVVSSLSVFSDQINTTRPARALARPDPGRPCRDLGTAWSRTLSEEPPCLLFDRHAAQTSLQPQASRYLLIEVADNDRRHDSC
jgi:hypothetical protein